MVPALIRRAYIGSAGPDYREAAETPDVRIHDLRDTYASFGVKGGQSLFVAGQLLGHSKLDADESNVPILIDDLSVTTTGDPY